MKTTENRSDELKSSMIASKKCPIAIIQVQMNNLQILFKEIHIKRQRSEIDDSKKYTSSGREVKLMIQRNTHQAAEK